MHRQTTVHLVHLALLLFNSLGIGWLAALSPLPIQTLNVKLRMSSERSFGFFFSVVFFTASAFFALGENGIKWRLAAVLGVLALSFAILACLWPSSLRSLNRAWYFFGLLLGKVFSPLVLGLIFFLLITPTSVITRLFGRDELRIRKRSVATYWVDRNPSGPLPQSFKNQF